MFSWLPYFTPKLFSFPFIRLFWNVPFCRYCFLDIFLIFLLSPVPERQSPLFGMFSFLLTISMSGQLDGIRSSVYISKSQRSFCVSFSRIDVRLSIYHLFVWSNLNFLHNSQGITLPIQSCLVLYSFCSFLLYSLIT